MLLQKARKALGNLATENAQAVATTRSLTTQLTELQSKKMKKKVSVDPNSQFANIETIKAAMEEAEARERVVQAKEAAERAKFNARQAIIGEAEAEKAAVSTSRAMEKAAMDACMFS